MATSNPTTTADGGNILKPVDAIAAETRDKNFSGPGILWAASRIRMPEQMGWASLENWYDEHIIPSLMEVPGIGAAFRAVATEYALERPLAVVSVTDDLGVFDSAAFKSMPDYTEKLSPGETNYWNLVDFETRWYSFIDCFEHAKKPLSETRSFMTTGWDITGDISPEYLDEWWRTHHCEQLSQLPGFIRTTRFKAQHAWWSAGDGATLPCPDYFEIIEFDHPDVDIMTIVEHPSLTGEAQEALNRLLEGCSFEFGGFRMLKTWGRDSMFKPDIVLKKS